MTTEDSPEGPTESNSVETVAKKAVESTLSRKLSRILMLKASLSIDNPTPQLFRFRLSLILPSFLLALVEPEPFPPASLELHH